MLSLCVQNLQNSGIFLTKNRRFNREKTYFCQKKPFSEKYRNKKSHECKKKHKKAHVLFTSTLYDPYIFSHQFCRLHIEMPVQTNRLLLGVRTELSQQHWRKWNLRPIR